VPGRVKGMGRNCVVKNYQLCIPVTLVRREMFVNDCAHRSHRKIRFLCNFTTGYASIIQDQAFRALNVHRNDCCGLGTTTAKIVTDGRTAIFETFTPFKCLTVLEVFCRYPRVLRLRSQETSSPHAAPCMN
jgi:hypothetical protein